MNSSPKPRLRIGFFTRLLDAVPAAERYRLAAAQVRHAEAWGFDSAWVAQHHFRAEEGGLPSPLVFLAHLAASTRRIRLGTGIVTLPMENPLRVAEDAAVLDLLCNGRLELGVGNGGTPSSFTAFSLHHDDRAALFDRHLAVVRNAWAGQPLTGGDRLYPAAPQLADRIWQATFSAAGGARAGRAGDGLMLSRTQPRPAGAPQASLAEIQLPVIDAYRQALPDGVAARVLASRSVFVADDRREARRQAEIGLRRSALRLSTAERPLADAPLDTLLSAFDAHVGTPDEVLASLRADRTLAQATDLSFQVHSIDPPHGDILRSIELIATRVAPALGWSRADNAAPSTARERFSQESLSA